MKTSFMFTAALAAGVAAAIAQTLPGAPEDNGLIPKSSTVYVNRLTAEVTTINNNNTESLGVAIANGGNVIVGWEDDAQDSEATPLLDVEAVWTLFDSAGVSITPDTEQSSIVHGGTVTSKWLSYFRANNSPVYGGTSWGPKIKANLFGDGIGMGATSFWLGEEVAELVGYDDQNMGDFPSVQLLSNTGQPVKALGGLDQDYAVRDASNIRIGDWDYLATGNIVVVGESRQGQDLIDLYGGDTAANHAVFRIISPSGNVVKAETLVSATPVKSEMWHGVGVTLNGFAVRFSGPGGATVRMFDNAGSPTTTNLDLGTLTQHPEAAGGGRGDGAGFHGNGKDAYVAVSGGGSVVWVTVLNTNGTVRFSKTVADDLAISSVGRTDAAIDQNGNVIVVFSAKFNVDLPALVMGRRFDATGKALGGTFHVSEKELPDGSAGAASGPRIAWRGGQVAVVWQSTSDFETLDPNTGEVMPVVALRIFSTFTPGSIESAGLTRIVPDTPIIKPDANALGNWEPYISVLGSRVFLIEGNTFAKGTLDSQRYVVALQPVAGGPMKMVSGFYADNGQPFEGAINLSRQNGNPGRVTGDTRPGAVNYMVGGEASPHGLAEFQSDNRWNLGFDRLGDGRYGTVQIFSLDVAALVPTPLCKAQDSAYGRLTSGDPQGNNQISRFGGDMVCLDNGNFVSVVEDRSKMFNPDGNAVTATIFAPNGSIVKDSFLVAPTPEATDRNVDIWSNVAAYRGGFAVRTKNPAGSSRVIYFHDNAGTFKGIVDQAATGASFDTGRGDGTRIGGHVNSPYVFLAARAANTTVVKVAAFDSRDFSFVAIADVNEGAFTGNFDRANLAVDALNRVTVSWVSQPAGYAKQQVAARVLAFDSAAKKFTPLTPSFFPFINTGTNDIRSLQMSVAMTTRQICIAAKGEINYANDPSAGPDSPTEVNFYTVFSHPAPADDPTTPVGAPPPTLSISRSGTQVTISWPAGVTGFTLESTPSLSGPTWTAVSGVSNNSVTVSAATGNRFFRLKK